ncbi:MAG: hypothetical protein ACYTEV_03305 [Planctomycetota bacterium]|jgi:hypothetical protein
MLRTDARFGTSGERPGAATTAVIALTASALLAGCGGGTSRPAGRTITLDAFLAPSADAASPDPDDIVASEEPVPATGPRDAGGAGGDGGEAAPTGGPILGAAGLDAPRLIGRDSEPTPPTTAPTRASGGLRAGDSFVVDALVGQINGRPIFAGEFFEPIGDQLRAMGREAATRTEFASAALPVIRLSLRRRVDEALYLAEAEAALSPEEQQGLRFWLREIQDVTVARRGGSRAEADRRLRETENRSLEEEVEFRRNAGLQSKLIRDRILPRVIVSKYDIEREYQRRYDEFNPPPSTLVQRLILLGDDEAAVTEVSERLERGDSILDVAAELAADGRGRVSEIGTFTLRPSQLANSEAVSEVFRRYAEGWERAGDWTGPVAGGRSTWWIFVAAVRQSEGRPVHDELVQRQLKAELEQRGMSRELARYEDQLRRESIVGEEQEMLEVLMEIALRRYGPR